MDDRPTLDNAALRGAVIGAEDTALRIVKAHVFGVATADLPANASRTLPEDELFGGSGVKLVPPPYDPQVLARLPEQSGELGQLIEAMETNVEGFGHRLVALTHPGPIPDDAGPDDANARLAAEIKAERIRLENFFNTAPEGMSFTALRRRKRKDEETLGFAFWEVIRNLKSEIVGLKHLTGAQIRLTVEDPDFTPVDTPVLVRDPDTGGYVLDTRLEYKRFRRFVQGQQVASATITRGVVSSTSRLRYFKAFGDPRVVDADTGAYVPAGKVNDWPDANGKPSGQPMPQARRASEVLHWRIYSSRSPYGLPRYAGNLLALLGARAAEEVNYTTLKNNNIPSMVAAVSGGRLTGGSIQRIEDFVRTQVSESGNRSKWLLLEGESAFDGEDAAPVKIDIKPLTNDQIQDALFQQYIKGNVDSLRRSFRLPPIFVGSTTDYNRATAEASRKLADEQVFAPERGEVDWTINHYLLPALGVKHHRFESRTPNVTDNQELIQMLASAERTGGITPRLSRAIVEDVFPAATELPPLDSAKFDPDVPFSLTMANAVKNMADPTEVNQQVAPVQPGMDGKAAGAHFGKSYLDAVVADLLDLGHAADTELQRYLTRDKGDAPSKD